MNGGDLTARAGFLGLSLHRGSRIYVIPYTAKSIEEVDFFELSDSEKIGKVRLVFRGNSCHYVREEVVNSAGGLETYFRKEEWRKRQKENAKQKKKISEKS